MFLACAVHARYGGKPDDGYIASAATLLPRSERRRAQILGRAIALAYRVSAGMPKVLGETRLRITADTVVLEIRDLARVPDSETVGDRLKLLAAAIGLSKVRIADLPPAA